MPKLRDDVILELFKILEISLTEQLLSMEEILSICFSTPDPIAQPDALYCVHCNNYLHMQCKRCVVHPDCHVVKWLVNTFGFKYIEGQLFTTTTNPAQTNHLDSDKAQQIKLSVHEINQGRQTQNQSSVTDKPVSIIKTDGKQRAITNQGFKHVRLKTP